MNYVIPETIGNLKTRIEELEHQNRKLNLDLMRKSAEVSEAQEKLKRWQTELEVLAEQRGHNLCHIGIPKLLKNTIGHTGKYPDPENISPEQFAQGCTEYHKNLFPGSEFVLEVVKRVRR